MKISNNELDNLLFLLLCIHLKHKNYEEEFLISLDTTINYELGLSAIETRALIATIAGLLIDYSQSRHPYLVGLGFDINHYFKMDEFILEPYAIEHVISKLNRGQEVAVIEFFEVFKISLLKIIRFEAFTSQDDSLPVAFFNSGY